MGGNELYRKIGEYRDKIEDYSDSIKYLNQALDISDSIDNGIIELSNNEIGLSEELIESISASEGLIESLILNPIIKTTNDFFNEEIFKKIGKLETLKSDIFLEIDILYDKIENNKKQGEF